MSELTTVKSNPMVVKKDDFTGYEIVQEHKILDDHGCYLDSWFVTLQEDATKEEIFKIRLKNPGIYEYCRSNLPWAEPGDYILVNTEDDIE